MANSYKVLAQACPSAAATETVLYTVPAATQTVVSTITVANLAGADTTCRINVRPAGAAVANQHALLRDATIQGRTTTTLSLAITLAATDVVSVQSGAANGLAFSIYGTEIA